MGKRYETNKSLVFREIAGEAVLIPAGDLAGNMMITLNETCAFIWRSFETPTDIDEVVQTANKLYDDPGGTMEQEIRAFVEDCVKAGIMKEA